MPLPEEECVWCHHVHGEYIGILDAMEIYGSTTLPDKCRDAAMAYVTHMTRRL